MKSYLPIALLLFLLAAGCTSGDVEEPASQIDTAVQEAQDAAPPQVDSSTLKETVITAHMEENIVPGKNLIYCSTFQIAWNELKDNIIKENIRLVDEPPIVKFLNKGLSTKDDISPDCYVAMVGFGKDKIVEKINKALKERFGEEAPVVEVELKSDWILAYAFLQKALQFKQKFERIEESIEFDSNGKTTEVKTFGIAYYRKLEHNQLGDQVAILDYKDDSDFIILLKSNCLTDEIITAKVRPQETLRETVEAVQTRVQSGNYLSMSNEDTLQIPILNIDVEYSYSELLNKYLRNKGFETYFMAKATQRTCFRLDEKGALLESEASLLWQGKEARPRRLIFDRPFLLYLKEKGAKYPYFAMWVENAELMVKE